MPYFVGTNAFDLQGKTREALEFLTGGLGCLKEQHIFRYKQAAYHSKLGEVKAAKALIGGLGDEAPAWRLKILEDTDFEPVWESLG